jgi:tight adherence protein C
MTLQANSSLVSLLPQGVSVDDFFIIATSLAAFVTLWSIGMALNPNRVEPRLQAIHRRREELKADYLDPKRHHSRLQEENPPWMERIVERFGNVKNHQQQKLRMRLVQAGYHNADLLVPYLFSKIALPFLGLFLGWLMSDVDWDKPFATDQLVNWLIILGSGYFFAVLPDLLLANKRIKRFDAVRLALPDTLDLMLICAEAGLSLSATLDRVANELGHAYPEMAEELSYTSVEIGFLPDRSVALKHLAERVDIQEVRGIVNVLQQTEKYGTPIGQALRVLSKEFRTERMLRAEQKAAKLPAIMTIPLILFILPTLFIIILTPAAINIMNTP